MDSKGYLLPSKCQRPVSVPSPHRIGCALSCCNSAGDSCLLWLAGLRSGSPVQGLAKSDDADIGAAGCRRDKDQQLVHEDHHSDSEQPAALATGMLGWGL